MKLVLDNITLSRNRWSLRASGVFSEGIHLITGDVGGGKTTLSLALAGFFEAESGSIRKEGIGSEMLSFQFPEYHVTGKDLTDECRSWGLDPVSILSQERINRSPDTDPLSLSRGELKRLHLACILEKRYDLLILDEPFSSMDCCEKDRFCRILSERKQGITIIFTHEQTHFPRADYIWEIQEGSLVFRGAVPEAIRHWNHAPAIIRQILESGKMPRNLSLDDILEAACRT